MVNFEESLQNNIWPAWKENYIDYNLLKRKLEGIKDAQREKQDEIIKARKHIFQGALDEELSEVSFQSSSIALHQYCKGSEEEGAGQQGCSGPKPVIPFYSSAN